MAKNFCTKCGHTLSKNDIYCKYCNAVVDVKAMTRDSGIKPKRKKSKAPIIIFAIILPILLICAGIFSLFYFEILDIDVIMSYLPLDNKEPEVQADTGEYPDEYQYIIDKTVEAYPWKDNGDASPIPEIESASPLYSQGQYISDIGFTTEDLNGDGTKELFVGLKTYTYGWVVIDIYTLHEGKTAHIAKADHNTSLIIKSDSSIIFEWGDSNSLTHGSANYFLPFDTDELDLRSGVVYDPNLALDKGIISNLSEATEDNSWFEIVKGEENQIYEPISKEDASSYLDTLYKNLYDMEFTPAKLPEGMVTEAVTTAPETEPEPEEVAPYEIILETNYSTENISPVSAVGYDEREFSSLFISVIESADKSSYRFIDYNGEVWDEYAYPSAPILDSLGDTLHDMSAGYVDKKTMEFIPYEQAMGHGFMMGRYGYIPSIGEVVTYIAGMIEPATNVPDSVVVNLLEECSTPSDPDFAGEYNGVMYKYTHKYGIAVNSALTVDCIYNDYQDYQDGICALEKDGKWAYFNSSGTQLTDFEYDFPVGASYGFIAVCKDGMWAYCDHEGNLVCDFEFEEARPVHRGMAWVKQDGYWKVIRLTDYSESFIETDATAAIIKYLDGRGISPSVALLSKEDSFTFYKTEGYCFYDNAGGIEYIVLYNGEVYRVQP